MASLTPIRVRGKKQTGSTQTLGSSLDPMRHGKRSLPPVSGSNLPAKSSRRESSISTSESVNSRCLSPFEQLPVELLEEIFFLCLNVSLPQASLAIGHKLASHRVKSQLTFRVLSSTSSTRYPCALAAIFPTLREQAEAQSAILRQKWMTLPFLKDIMPDFIVKTLVRELGERGIRWMGNGPVVSKDIEPLIRQYIEENGHRRWDVPKTGLPAYWELEWPATRSAPMRYTSAPKRYMINLGSGRPLPLREYDVDMNLVRVGIGLRDGLVTVWEAVDHGPEFDTQDQMQRWHMKFRILSCVEGCRIPGKLLHGPWTDEKCEFLEIAIRGNATVDWIETTNGEVAKQGLLQALREHNAWAMRLLLTRLPTPPDTFRTQYYPDSEARTKKKASISSFREDPARRGVGIVPEYEHLRIAVLEEGCDKDVVNALIDCPGFAVNIDKTEVWEWAFMEGIRGNERANWLRQQFRLKQFVNF